MNIKTEAGETYSSRRGQSLEELGDQPVDPIGLLVMEPVRGLFEPFESGRFAEGITRPGQTPGRGTGPSAPQIIRVGTRTSRIGAPADGLDPERRPDTSSASRSRPPAPTTLALITLESRRPEKVPGRLDRLIPIRPAAAKSRLGGEAPLGEPRGSGRPERVPALEASWPKLPLQLPLKMATGWGALRITALVEPGRDGGRSASQRDDARPSRGRSTVARSRPLASIRPITSADQMIGGVRRRFLGVYRSTL